MPAQHLFAQLVNWLVDQNHVDTWGNTVQTSSDAFEDPVLCFFQPSISLRFFPNREQKELERQDWSAPVYVRYMEGINSEIPLNLRVNWQDGGIGSCDGLQRDSPVLPWPSGHTHGEVSLTCSENVITDLTDSITNICKERGSRWTAQILQGMFKWKTYIVC